MKQLTPASVPYGDQYVGAWSIREENLAVLLHRASQINVQLHLQHVADNPVVRAGIEERAATDFDVYEADERRVAVVELSGSLMKHASSFAPGSSMTAARRAIRSAANDPGIAAIMLNIDSPGGTVAGLVDLADDVAAAKARKPLGAFVSDLAASAAYWIASQASQIYVNNASGQVGSIGVFSVVTDWSAYAEKEGAKVHVIRFGSLKGAGVAGTEITPEQLTMWQERVDQYGEMFVNAVAQGRGLAAADVRQLATGQTFLAEEAVSRRLVDQVATFEQAIEALLQRAAPSQSRRSAARNTKGSVMSEQHDAPTAPQAATLQELEAIIPQNPALSEAERALFLTQQLKAGATQVESLAKFTELLADKLQASEQRHAERDKAQQTPPPAKTRGVPPVGEGKNAAADEGGLDFRALAQKYRQEHNCRWDEACLAIKRQFPEAVDAFMGS